MRDDLERHTLMTFPTYLDQLRNKQQKHTHTHNEKKQKNLLPTLSEVDF